VANQFDVVTFDYRGIGGSSPNSLRGFEMDYLD
jgi:predicted alpha/beta hydrolase